MGNLGSLHFICTSSLNVHEFSEISRRQGSLSPQKQIGP